MATINTKMEIDIKTRVRAIFKGFLVVLVPPLYILQLNCIEVPKLFSSTSHLEHELDRGFVCVPESLRQGTQIPLNELNQTGAESGNGEWTVYGEFNQGRKILEDGNILWESFYTIYLKFKERGKLRAH
ncbi:hypothetical protein C8J57DRAFT_1249701 [Mycena rebaudengoi]|nr:hypothetical protein C8J57DRAFT_1249701 [Mycena rebaudengoi]